MDYAVTTYWYVRPAGAAMRTAADLAVDYRIGPRLRQGGIPDTAGDGRWVYLSSSDADSCPPLGPNLALVYGDVGGGATGLRRRQNGHNLAAISDRYLFVDGDDNVGVQGSWAITSCPCTRGHVFSGAFRRRRRHALRGRPLDRR